MVTNPVGCLSSSYLRALGTSVLPLMTIDINTYAPSNVPTSISLFNLYSCAGAILDQTTNLETPNLQMCGGIQHEAPIPTFPKLKTLRITHSRLNEKDLEGLLSSCTGLRTFVFEATYPYISRLDCVQDFGPRDHFSLDNAVKHLSRHRATLKSLHLDLRKRGVGYFLSEVNARPPFFHLKDFKALEHLFFNSHGIYGANHSLKTKGNNSERQDPERLSHMNRSEGSIRLPRREFLSVWFRSEAARIAIPKYAASAPPRISFTNVLCVFLVAMRLNGRKA